VSGRRYPVNVDLRHRLFWTPRAGFDRLLSALRHKKNLKTNIGRQATERMPARMTNRFEIRISQHEENTVASSENEP